MSRALSSDSAEWRQVDSRATDAVAGSKGENQLREMVRAEEMVTGNAMKGKVGDGKGIEDADSGKGEVGGGVSVASVLSGLAGGQMSGRADGQGRKRETNERAKLEMSTFEKMWLLSAVVQREGVSLNTSAREESGAAEQRNQQGNEEEEEEEDKEEDKEEEEENAKKLSR